MLETFNSLLLGFSVALQPQILMYAFIGCLIGTLVGMLPGVGPLAGLEGRRIGLFWNGFTNGNLLLEALADILGKRCRGLSFVKLPAGRELDWGHYPERSLTDIVREYAIDAAIAGPGC